MKPRVSLWLKNTSGVRGWNPRLGRIAPAIRNQKLKDPNYG